MPRVAGRDPKTGGQVLEKPDARTRRPDLWNVILLNDDYTTMDFVVRVLEGVFRKSPAEAFRIMMAVHTQGKGVAGTYAHEIAETKAAQVHDQARAEGFPLRCDVEEA